MTRLEHLREGVMSADDALQRLRAKVVRGRLPDQEEIEGCILQLGLGLATIKGSLTLPADVPEPPEPPGDDLWFRQGAMG